MGYKLSEIVNELLIEMGESGAGTKPARFYQMGVSFLRRTNMDTSGFPKIVILDISKTDTANLPIDYLQYTKIALCVNGKMLPLGLNNNICLDKRYDDCGNLIADAGGNGVVAQYGNSLSYVSTSAFAGNGITGSPNVADNLRNGENMGRQFGIGANFNVLGSYRIDEASHTIQFADLATKGDVVMEYLADIDYDSVTGDFEVHPFMVEALKNYIFWQYKVRSSKPLGEQQLAEKQFNDTNRIMRVRFRSNTMSEWSDAFATANRATPKLD